MNFAIALVTCDRTQFGQPDYFDRTWASLCRSGLLEQLEGDRLCIFEAGPGHGRARRLARECGVPVYGAPPGVRLDVVRNMHRAFAWMCGAGCELGMLLVDDLLMCRNTLPRARAWLAEAQAQAAGGAPDVRLYSLATQYRFTVEPRNLARGWAPYPVERFYGGLGAILPREVLLGYLLGGHRQQAELATSGIDMALKRHIADRGGRILAHCPNLVRHIGMGSTLGHAHRDDDHYFPGEDFDAMRAGCP